MKEDTAKVRKILCVCDLGNNRSVQFAHLLRYKYQPCDTIPVGVEMHSKETLDMLYKWADIIIAVSDKVAFKIPVQFEAKVKIWDVGKRDIYPRPFNAELYRKAKQIIEDNKLWED